MTSATILKCADVIRSLPEGIPMPEIAEDPDGELSLEWYASPQSTFSVSVGEEGNLAYAWLRNGERGHGKGTFSGSLPDEIMELIRKQCGCP